MSKTRTPKAAPKARINLSYWVALPLLAFGIAIAPIAFVLVAYLSTGASTNAFNENGYGAALWLLFFSVPAGIVVFVSGVLMGITLEIAQAINRRKGR